MRSSIFQRFFSSPPYRAQLVGENRESVVPIFFFSDISLTVSSRGNPRLSASTGVQLIMRWLTISATHSQSAGSPPHPLLPLVPVSASLGFFFFSLYARALCSPCRGCQAADEFFMSELRRYRGAAKTADSPAHVGGHVSPSRWRHRLNGRRKCKQLQRRPVQTCRSVREGG